MFSSPPAPQSLALTSSSGSCHLRASRKATFETNHLLPAQFPYHMSSYVLAAFGRPQDQHGELASLPLLSQPPSPHWPSVSGTHSPLQPHPPAPKPPSFPASGQVALLPPRSLLSQRRSLCPFLGSLTGCGSAPGRLHRALCLRCSLAHSIACRNPFCVLYDARQPKTAKKSAMCSLRLCDWKAVH